MAQLFNGGSVTVEDGIKASQEYAPARKVIVTLTFDVGENENAPEKLAAVSAAADAKVKELLGRAAKAAEVAAKVTTTAPTTPKPEPEVKAATERKKAAGPKAKANGADTTAKTDKDKLAEAAGLPATNGDDPLLGGGEGSETASETSSSGADLLAGIEDNETPPKEISDAELNRIVSEHLEKYKSAPDEKRSAISMGIRKHMQKFVGEGKPMQLRSIPQANRAEFVKLVGDTK